MSFELNSQAGNRAKYEVLSKTTTNFTYRVNANSEIIRLFVLDKIDDKINNQTFTTVMDDDTIIGVYSRPCIPNCDIDYMPYTIGSGKTPLQLTKDDIGVDCISGINMCANMEYKFQLENYKDSDQVILLIFSQIGL